MLITTFNEGPSSFTFGTFYEIEKERIDTPEKLEQWLNHLRRKIWFSYYLEGQLVAAAKRNFKG